MAQKNNEVKAQEGTDAPSKSYSLRGMTFVGEVVSAKAHKTVSVQWQRRRFVKKYERYEVRTSKVAAHVPEGMSISEGDTVRIQETRPISKTKHFVVVEVMK
ncbi:MAG: 30S ribosomal protein S17 [Candidatus Woesearchaeota archaeon]